MSNIALWKIDGSNPERLESSEVALERSLEEWIEADPSVLEEGLTIVGRQMRLDGGPLDLLAIDPNGRWVLIEIKRGRLRRDALAQAIDYASCIQRLSSDELRNRCQAYLERRGSESTMDQILQDRGVGADDLRDREVIISLVGFGYDAGLERMIEFLESRAELSIRVVSLSVFENPAGGLLLSRDVHEAESSPRSGRSASPGSGLDAAEILGRADEQGTGEVVRILQAAAVEAGLHERLWATSVMFAPSTFRSRCLFTVWIGSKRESPGMARVYVAPTAFEEFMGVSLRDATELLGEGGFRWMGLTEAREFATGLATLLDSDRIEERREASETAQAR